MNGIDKIKDKIKKLFALSKSPNANESAIALEMAQKLMEEYSIYSDGIDLFDITEENILTSSGRKPPVYELYLINSIAQSFSCKAIRQYSEKTEWRYAYTLIGPEHRSQVAAFIATVLLRKLKRARLEYMETLSRVRTRSTKIKRGDDFCHGWVSVVVKKLHPISVPSEEEKALIQYMKKYTNLKTQEGIQRKSVNGHNDYLNGSLAAKNVQIQHGVEGQESGVRLLGSR
jgi:hypothetical protein